jgi:NADH-quinone oxidoreductase subunit L
MIIGAITALFMGFLGIIQNDIKRVIAYSTLSQLGYMTVALGASAYSVAIFHLMTHAFFKALLFLAAGSVIIGMHHDQDIRNMGGLRKYMPITWITSLIGSLALIGTPFFSGFYSKDSIIEAVEYSHLPGSGFAYFAVLAGVFVTAFYSFRLYFLVFHGEERFGMAHPSTDSTSSPQADSAQAHAKAHHDVLHDANEEAHEVHVGDHDDEEVSADHHHGLAPGQKPHETPWVVWLPLVLLAIPSVVIGYIAIEPMLFGGYFKDAIFITAEHGEALNEMHEEFHGAFQMAAHSLISLPFLLAMAGVGCSWFFYMKRPDIPAAIQKRFQWIYTVLDNKYYFDRFNDWFFAGGARGASTFLSRFGDKVLIDGLLVNGTAGLVGKIAGIVRRFQSGYIYHYAFTMITGVFVLLTIRTWFE